MGNELTVTRDHEADYPDRDDWDRTEITGEETGRLWYKFTGRVRYVEEITVLAEDVCDPLEWV